MYSSLTYLYIDSIHNITSILSVWNHIIIYYNIKMLTKNEIFLTHINQIFIQFRVRMT